MKQDIADRLQRSIITIEEDAELIPGDVLLQELRDALDEIKNLKDKNTRLRKTLSKLADDLEPIPLLAEEVRNRLMKI